MTTSVRISLLSLRAYLVLMMLLVFYHVLGMAGLFGHRGSGLHYRVAQYADSLEFHFHHVPGDNLRVLPGVPCK